MAELSDAEIDASYAAYDDVPFDAPDEWATSRPSAMPLGGRELGDGQLGLGVVVRGALAVAVDCR